MKIIETITMLMPLLAAAPGFVFGEAARPWGLLIVAIGLICTWIYLGSGTKNASFYVYGAATVYLVLLLGAGLYRNRNLDSAILLALAIMSFMVLMKNTPKD